uniref:Aminotransferase-like plant mobile domain-containing protein n=1 Tax=Oryza punctata TaxID=4537 RepID=A0A0E0KG23_ORYPU
MVLTGEDGSELRRRGRAREARRQWRGGKIDRRDLINADMEEEWPYPLLSKEIDARHHAKKISDGNSCSTLAVVIPRTAGWWGIDPRWKPRQKRQADNRYRRSMHLRMTPWIEAWSQALNDVVHETRAYDHNTYEQYMAWYSSQTRIWLLAPEDPDERGPPNIEQIYDMQHAPPAHLTTDIAGELVREAKTLWEKLRDGIAGTNQEVMAAVDSLRRKGKRIMRLASCRHSSDVYTTATSRRTFEQMLERPSTSSWPSTSVRPSASARRSTDGRAAVRSTSVREAPTIPTIPEITQMSERLVVFGPTQGNANGPSRASDTSCKATYDSSNDSRYANLTLARGICTICRSLIDYLFPGLLSRFHYMHLHMAPTHDKDNPLITVGYMDLLQQGDWLFGQYPSHRDEIPYMQAPSTGFRPYTASYGDMSNFGGGSSSVPNELRASQTDDAP